MGATLVDLAAAAARRARGTKLERTLTELERAQISERIKQARQQAGLTQEELADLIHVRARTIANYEAGRVPWRLLGQIAEATDVTQQWLLHGDGVGAAGRDGQAGQEEILARLETALNTQQSVLQAVQQLAETVDRLAGLVESVLPEARRVQPRKRRTA